MFNGIYTAIVTPFTNDGESVDYESLENLILHQLENKISGLVVCGSTGEAATLTEDEYISVLTFAKEKVKDAKLSYDCKLIAGVGTNNTAFGVKLAKEVSLLNCDAVLVVAPPYNKPSQDGIYEHIKAIGKASNTNVIGYNVPGRTVSDILPKTVKRLADDKIIVGLKEASGNFSKVNEVLSLCRNDIDILLGEDAFILPSVLVGAKGGISVVSNVFPKEMMEMFNLAFDLKNKSDLKSANDIQYRLLPFISLLFSETNPVPVKYALYKKGIIKDYSVRLPLLKALPKTREALDDYLNGF